MISRSSSFVNSTRRTMSTAGSSSSTTPSFPAPIPITYSWSTPNALRRLSLPPLTTAAPPTARTPPRSRPVGRMHLVGQGPEQQEQSIGRARPRGRRSLPRPPQENGVRMSMPNPADYRRASDRTEPVGFHNPFYAQATAPAPAPLPSYSQAPTIPLPPTPSPSQIAYLNLEPLVPVWTESQQERGRAAVEKRLPGSGSDLKEKESAKRLSISGLVAILRRSASRSRSRTREAKRNLLDDE